MEKMLRNSLTLFPKPYKPCNHPEPKKCPDQGPAEEIKLSELIVTKNGIYEASPQFQFETDYRCKEYYSSEDFLKIENIDSLQVIDSENNIGYLVTYGYIEEGGIEGKQIIYSTFNMNTGEELAYIYFDENYGQLYGLQSGWYYVKEYPISVDTLVINLPKNLENCDGIQEFLNGIKLLLPDNAFSDGYSKVTVELKAGELETITDGQYSPEEVRQSPSLIPGIRYTFLEYLPLNFLNGARFDNSKQDCNFQYTINGKTIKVFTGSFEHNGMYFYQVQFDFNNSRLWYLYVPNQQVIDRIDEVTGRRPMDGIGWYTEEELVSSEPHKVAPPSFILPLTQMNEEQSYVNMDQSLFMQAFDIPEVYNKIKVNTQITDSELNFGQDISNSI